MASRSRGYIGYVLIFEDPECVTSAQTAVTVMTIMTTMRDQAIATRQWLGIVGAAKATRELSVGHPLDKEPHHTCKLWLVADFHSRTPPRMFQLKMAVFLLALVIWIHTMGKMFP